MDADVFYNRFADQEYSFTGLLPHLNQGGKLQFITFHLADSLPRPKYRQLAEWKAAFLKNNPLPWDEDIRERYASTISDRVSQLLDNGYGSCCLRLPHLRKIVADAIHHFHGKSYHLLAYVVMPNHVHLLVCVYPESNVGHIAKSIKGYSAYQINKLQQRSGTLWQKDYYDRIIRTPAHLDRCLDYIRANPASLPASHFTLYP